jgi:hypothetical protein
VPWRAVWCVSEGRLSLYCRRAYVCMRKSSGWCCFSGADGGSGGCCMHVCAHACCIWCASGLCLCCRGLPAVLCVLVACLTSSLSGVLQIPFRTVEAGGYGGLLPAMLWAAGVFSRVYEVCSVSLVHNVGSSVVVVVAVFAVASHALGCWKFCCCVGLLATSCICCCAC